MKDIRRTTSKHYSAAEKIRIVLEGLRVGGEYSVAELCRCEGIAERLYYTNRRATCRELTQSFLAALVPLRLRHQLFGLTHT